MASEFGDFLRARRAAAAAGSAASGGRRLVSGLRREEVATAAGISADYYTRLEQGRETHPSDAVLESLAKALQLTADGRAHLFRLRDAPPSRADESREQEDPELVERMTALVEALRPNPAYVLDRLSDMVAANAEGLALYAGFADLPPHERNTCRYLMTDPRAREIFAEWEDIARGAVAHLRAANAGALQDERLKALVAELSARSPLFAAWWTEHHVARRRGVLAHLRASDGSIVARRLEVLYLPEDGMRMTIWLPEHR